MVKEFEFYKKKLKNGLTVLFEKRKLPVVTSSVSVKFGSEYEPMALKGVSHFIEHLVFKGTKSRTNKQISEEIEKKGGILNAFTSEEVTSYWNKLPSKHLHTGISLLADLALNPLFNNVDLEKERKVILEEIKMYHDNPQVYVLEKIKELLYKKPFGMFGAGTNETMSKMSRQDVLGVFNSAYSTNNMILAIVGKSDFQGICNLGEKVFPVVSKVVIERAPVMQNQNLIEKRKGVDQANLVLAWHVPTLSDRMRYSIEALDVILGKGMSSRLFSEIREKRGLAYTVRGFLEQDKNYGHEMIYVGTTKDKVMKVKELILKEIKKMQKLEKRDLDEAKEQLIGLRKVASENSEAVMTAMILEENAGKAEEYYRYEEKIKDIKLKDVRSLAKLPGYSFLALIPA